MNNTPVQKPFSAIDREEESDAGVEPYVYSSSSYSMSIQSGDSEFLGLLDGPIEESVPLEGRFRPAACLKRDNCVSAVASCLNALVEDISRQNWKLGDKSIDKKALLTKLHDIVLQRTLVEFEEHTNRKKFAAEYTSEDIRKKYMCLSGMLEQASWKEPKNSLSKGISKESFALLNWAVSKLSGFSPKDPRHTFVGSSKSSKKTFFCNNNSLMETVSANEHKYLGHGDTSGTSSDEPNVWLASDSPSRVAETSSTPMMRINSSSSCAPSNFCSYAANPNMSLRDPSATFAKIVENVNLQFVNEFNDVYKRNNKKGGIKSLRCFPLCKEFGHSKSNYCGRTLALISSDVSQEHLCDGYVQVPSHLVPYTMPVSPKQLSKTPGNSFGPVSDQYLLVVISTEADNNLDTIFKKNLVEHYYNLRQLNSRRPAEEDVGKMMHMNDLLNLQRCKSSVTQQSIYIVTQEQVSDKSDGLSTFRIHPSSWVYGWISGRHSANVKHTVCGYLFYKARCNETRTSNMLICIAKTASAPFNIWSTKRCRSSALAAKRPPTTPIKNNDTDEAEEQELDLLVSTTPLDKYSLHRNHKRRRKLCETLTTRI